MHRESAPCNTTNKAIVIVQSFIGDILTEVHNGSGYADAEFNARVKIYQSVNHNFNHDGEYIKDLIYRDIPSVDNSLFVLTMELILTE